MYVGFHYALFLLPPFLSVYSTLNPDVQAGLGRPINSFPTLQVVAKELDVIGTVRYTAGCFQTAIDFMAEGKIDLKPMITKTYPLRESKEALEAVKRGGDLKVVVMSQQ